MEEGESSTLPGWDVAMLGAEDPALLSLLSPPHSYSPYHFGGGGCWALWWCVEGAV